MEARDKFQQMLTDTAPSAFPGQGPKHAGEVALPHGRHGPAAGRTDAPVPPRRRPLQKIVPVLEDKALVVCAGLAAEGPLARVLRHACLVAVLAVHCHGAQPAFTAALAG